MQIWKKIRVSTQPDKVQLDLSAFIQSKEKEVHSQEQVKSKTIPTTKKKSSSKSSPKPKPKPKPTPPPPPTSQPPKDAGRKRELPGGWSPPAKRKDTHQSSNKKQEDQPVEPKEKKNPTIPPPVPVKQLILPIPHLLAKFKIPPISSKCMEEFIFFITGTPGYLTKKDLEDLIIRSGGEVRRSYVSKDVGFVFKGQNPDEEQVERAQSLGICFVDDEWFVDFVKRNIDWNPIRGSELWTSAFRPPTTADILADPESVGEVRQWIANWSETQPRKALLIYGPPGIGKTTSVEILSRENGRDDVIERNASDCRAKSTLAELRITVQAMGKQDSLLLMDEIDGIDHGGIGEFISIIKLTKIPIICICNDRYAKNLRSLETYCTIVRFQAPSIDSIKARVNHVCKKTRMNISSQIIDTIVTNCHGDMRAILNQLQTLSFSPIPPETFDCAEIENINIGPFEVTSKLFNSKQRPQTQRDLYRLYETDPVLVPLFVHELYLERGKPLYIPIESLRRKNQKAETLLQRISRASDSISMSDTINWRTSSWDLRDEHSFFSTIFPTSLLHSDVFVRPRFPKLLGSESTVKKYTNILLHARSASKELWEHQSFVFVENYGPLIEFKLCKFICENAMLEALDLLDAYRISKDTYIDISELYGQLTRSNRYKSIPAKIKTAFSKAYSKRHISSASRSNDPSRELEDIDN